MADAIYGNATFSFRLQIRFLCISIWNPIIFSKFEWQKIHIFTNPFWAILCDLCDLCYLCSSHTTWVWSFRLWFGPLPCVGLKRIQIGCFAMRPQPEVTPQISHTGSSLVLLVLWKYVNNVNSQKGKTILIWAINQNWVGLQCECSLSVT